MKCFMIIQRYIYQAVMGFAVFAIFGFSMFWLYYNFFDSYTLPYVTEPIEIVNPNNEIAIGDTIVMKLVIQKTELLPIESNSVNITCDDGNLITMVAPEMAGTLPVGEHVSVIDSYDLPAKATIGSRCQFNFINTYHINQYIEETVIWSSEQFKVLKGAE